jgi:hypothetical protein
MGTGVIDIDEFDNHFSGTATAWDDNPAYPSSFVRFRTSSKSVTHQLATLPVTHIDNLGNPLSLDIINQLKATNISLPATVDISLHLNENELAIQWLSSIGTSGGGIATASKSRGGLPSDLAATPAKGWDGFKCSVNTLPQKRYIFRGQADNKWRLRTSFHRTGRADLQRYSTDDIPDLLRTFSALTSHVFDLANPNHYAAIINLAQHHGYPTPILDWTWSPYVAAFFAFRHVKRKEASTRKVRIFKLDFAAWNELPKADKLFPWRPNLTVLNPLAFGNPRAIPQQSISIVSNVDDIETHIENVERDRSRKYLEVFDLPLSDRQLIMKELALMGITAGALFPGLDGACEALKERNF